jgi:hypothetical protein
MLVHDEVADRSDGGIGLRSLSARRSGERQDDGAHEHSGND